MPLPTGTRKEQPKSVHLVEVEAKAELVLRTALSSWFDVDKEEVKTLIQKFKVNWMKGLKTNRT